MLKKAISAISTLTGGDDRAEGTALAVAGMASLLTGQRAASLAMFSDGLRRLERSWRAAHPDFQGGLRERFAEAIAYYEKSHMNQTNRTLHVVGIPMIAGGALGLLTMPTLSPMWVASAGAFTAGWALNIAGHALFEKNAPAFADDPLSFLAGPIWDLKQLVTRRQRAEPALASAA